MKRKNLISAIAFVFSVAIFMVSGAIYIHSAQQQTTQSTLNVAYVADNVSFTATAYYQLAGSNNTVSLVNTSDSNNTTLTFTPANTSTTKTLSATSDIALNVTNNYVLLTFAFTNTASNGGYCIKVSLTDGITDKSNVNVTYLASSSSYTTTSAGLTTQIANVTSTSAPTDVYIQAQQTKYFYVLVEVDNLYVNSSYNSTLQNGLVWDVVSTDITEEPYLVTLNANGSSFSSTSNDTKSFSAGNPATSSFETPLINGRLYEVISGVKSSAYISSGNFGFNGWWTAPIGGTQVSMVTSNCTLYAHWTVNDSYIVDTSLSTVLVGRYPQTVVSDSTIISALNGLYSASTISNGSSNGATGKTYTVPNGMNTATMPEYLYDGNHYARLAAANPYDNNQTFPSNSGSVTSSTYWFRVEPISMSAASGVNYGTGVKVYVTDKVILGGMCYADVELGATYALTDCTSWLDSPYRTFINSTVYPDVMQKNSSNVYSNSTTANVPYSGAYDYYNVTLNGDNAGTISGQYSFIPSLYEIAGGWDGYGPSSSIEDYNNTNPARIALNTDLTIATHKNGWTSYWLRTSSAFFEQGAGCNFAIECDGTIAACGEFLSDGYMSTWVNCGVGGRLCFAFST